MLLFFSRGLNQMEYFYPGSWSAAHRRPQGFQLIGWLGGMGELKGGDWGGGWGCNFVRRHAPCFT